MILQGLEKSLRDRARSWAAANGIGLPGRLELAAPPAHIATDICLAWPLAAAKAARLKPLDVAADMAEEFKKLPEIDTASPSPPGFVNLRLKTEALLTNLEAVASDPTSYGREDPPSQRSVLIEFVSANPTGPLHMASGRGATLGDSLARILKRLGRRVHSEYYVNDAGGRVDILGESLKARYEQRQGKDTPVPEKGYQGEYLVDLAASVPAEAATWNSQQFGRYAMDRLLTSHKEDMRSFGVQFDRWFHESELYAGKAVEETLDFLKKRGMVYEKESAVWLGTASDQESGDDKDRVLVKSTGQPTYFLPDIAYHKNKYDRGFDELIDIFGADHHGYVPRMRAAIAALGRAPADYHAIVHQLVHLFRGKESVKMSKRAGTFISLSELLDEVGKDACRFFFAQRTANAHMNFDLELAKKQSSDNPVYYCQYVHARICSLFKEARRQNLLAADLPPRARPQDLTTPEERAILLKLAWFPAILKTCENELSPHPLANFILELAGLFHPFYEKCRVVDPAEPGLTCSRLALCAGARDVIAEGLGLLGVSAPEEM